MPRRWALSLRREDGSKELKLNLENGFAPQRFDTGHPDIRTVSERNPDFSGSQDFTNLYGQRTITASFGLAWELTKGQINSDTDVEDRLMEWFDPSLRYRLVFRELRRTQERSFYVAPKNKSNPLNLREYDFPILICQWNAPWGVSQDLTPRRVILSPSTIGELGRTYDREGDRVYPPSPVIGQAIARNNGTAKATPILYIHGPCIGPSVEHVDQQVSLKFKDEFEILAGQYVKVDFRTGEILLNGDPSNPRYEQLDHINSDWFLLDAKADNRLKFNPLESASPSQVIVDYFYEYL